MNTMDQMKTVSAKIKESALAAQVFSVILMLLMLITGVAQVIRAMAEPTATEAPDAWRIFADCLLMAIIMAASAGLFSHVYKEGTPFSKKSTRKIRSIAIIMLLDSVVPPIVRASALAILGGADAVTGVSSNLAALLLGIILLFLAQIFSYGAILQQESDETL